MVRFVYFLLVFECLLSCSASAPYIIELVAKKYSHVTLRNGTLPSFFENKTFEIHVYSDAHVLGVQCKSEKNKLVHFDSYILYSETYYAPINNLQTIATTAMNGSWWCVLYYPPYGQKNTQFNLQVDIRESDPPHLLSKSDDRESSSDSIWYISSAVATGVTAIVVAVAVRERRLKTSAREATAGTDNGNGNGNSNIGHVYESVSYSACGNAEHKAVIVGADENGAHRTADPCDGNGDNDNAYESVHYLPFVNPGLEGVASSSDIASRPPYPLPPEEDEGTQKYVHYDTVYAERLQHMMMMDQLRRQARK